MRRRYYWLAVFAVMVLIAGAVLLFRPRVLPPPGAETATSPASSRPLSTVSTAGSEWPRTWQDYLGKEVTLERPAERIIALSPNLAEIVCAVGGCEQLVGVTEFCDYPPEAAAKAKVGGIINPDLERILGLEPDLILVAHGIHLPLVERIQELGVPVASSNPTTLAEIRELITQVGEMTGHEGEAAVVVADLRQREELVEQRAAAAVEEAPRVLMLLYWEGLWVGGVDSFVDDAIEQAGGVNAVQFMPVAKRTGWPQITREALAEGAPEVLLVAGAEAAPPGSPEDTVLERLRREPLWSELPAVQAGRVAVIDPDLLTIPSPRLWEGLEQMVEAIAGESE